MDLLSLLNLSNPSIQTAQYHGSIESIDLGNFIHEELSCTLAIYLSRRPDHLSGLSGSMDGMYKSSKWENLLRVETREYHDSKE